MVIHKNINVAYNKVTLLVQEPFHYKVTDYSKSVIVSYHLQPTAWFSVTIIPTIQDCALCGRCAEGEAV